MGDGPARSTTSPVVTSPNAQRIASARSSSIRYLPPTARTPRATPSAIARGSSPLGLSAVITARSASWPTIPPIRGRFPGSASPLAPNTTTRRRAWGRSEDRISASAGGLWA